jgi:DNA-binding response OmpR family regulator
MECHLLSALMEEETPLSCHQIQTILQNNINKNLSVDSVRVSIYRIRRKLKEGIGLDVIKNKYGVGYYIAI